MTQMISNHYEPSALSSKDRALIGELHRLATELDRHGQLADVASEDAFLPADVLEQPAPMRTAHLEAARDRCRRRFATLQHARMRRRMAAAVMLPFALGVATTLALAGTPYIVRLLA